uniref:CCR4-NOT transcription complex subunit 3 n=1 Tax=Phallusia mammillata TaxID=59560 RepID=A0A6F9DAA4_9ASCI|nr:CCR4-NOT transcription complex subunit 3-like [Phallusia mammillata]
MADKRKLQGEMDRCFKKIVEGVETFEDIWQKLYNANNTNQKDKYESDLKKEIKKLQRLRDQIKTWAASNEIKDKKILLDNRKLIETQMERFKVVERETKTKAYSKEGLGLAQKVDPAQKEKEETMQWLQVTIDSINQQIDMFESEIESMSSHSRKKKIDREKQDRIDELKVILEKHRFHIKNLETLMRMLDNETIQPDKINIIRDDIEYYLEACQDPDYEDNEFIYEDMGLDDTLAIAAAASPVDKQMNSSINNSNPLNDEETTTKSPDPSPSPLNTTNHSSSSSTKDDERKRNKSDDLVSPRKPNSNPPRSGRLPSYSTPTTTASAPISKQIPKNAHPPPVHTQPYAAAAGGMHTVTSNHVSQTVVSSSRTSSTSESPSPTKKSQQSRPNDIAASWHTNNNHVTNSETNTSEVQSAVNSIVSSVASLTVNGEVASTSPTSVSSTDLPADTSAFSTAPTPPAAFTAPTIGGNLPNGPQNGQMPPMLGGLNSLKTMAEQAVANAGLEQQSATSPVFTHSDSLTSVSNHARPDLVSLVSAQQQNTQMAIGGGEARIQPLLGVAPLGPISLSKDNHYQQAMLEACYRHMPHPSDAERLRHYLPRNPCPTPVYYHQSPLPHHDTIDFYLRLSTETLFFIFYYMEATKAQYMAAKALKKQSWRFHTKYMMWFQRHEEPKTITDEYEQGTYIYFDYEKWGQRKKEGFTFEYRYLEDRELQ